MSSDFVTIAKLTNDERRLITSACEKKHYKHVFGKNLHI